MRQAVEITDPTEAAEIFRACYDRAVADFTNGGSVHVFRATLHGLGFLPSAIEAEVGLHWPTTVTRLPQDAIKAAEPTHGATSVDNAIRAALRRATRCSDALAHAHHLAVRDSRHDVRGLLTMAKEATDRAKALLALANDVVAGPTR